MCVNVSQLTSVHACLYSYAPFWISDKGVALTRDHNSLPCDFIFQVLQTEARTFFSTTVLLQLRRLWGYVDKWTCSPALLQLCPTSAWKVEHERAVQSPFSSIYQRQPGNWHKIEEPLCFGVVISFRFYYWYFDALKNFCKISCRLVMGHDYYSSITRFSFFFVLVFAFLFMVFGHKKNGPVSLPVSAYIWIQDAFSGLSPHVHHLQIDAWSIHSQSKWQYNHIVLKRPAQRLTDSLIHFVIGPRLQEMKRPKALEGFQKRADDRILGSRAKSQLGAEPLAPQQRR